MQNGTKVAYSTIQSGTVLGKIVRTGRDTLGDFAIVKVTSRNNSTYPHGLEFAVTVGTPWLTERS